MKTIIVPINFSPCAENAARYAADFALAVKADLLLLHVIQIPVTSAELMMTEDAYREITDAAQIALKEVQVDLARRTHQKIKIDIRLEDGSISAKVSELCQEFHPYAVVIGSTGPTFEKFLAGSPVTTLLHDLDCPVLVVPVDMPFRHFHNVVLACDIRDIGSGMPHSLPLLRDLRNHFGSRFDVVTVETAHAFIDESQIYACDAWKEELKELYPNIHYIHAARVEQGILKYLGHHEVDLIMVFPKKHGLFNFHVSQSRKLAQHSPIPVLSLYE